MRALGLVLAAAAAIACGVPKDRAIRLQRLAAQRQNLDTTFDQLEARLAASQARVRFWQEIRERQESASAVACVSQEEHPDQMARHVLPESPVERRARVASATHERAPARVPATAGAPTRARD